MFDWNRDMICDVQLILFTANELWHKQCFTHPTKKTTQNILNFLNKAKQELEEIIDELEELP